MALTWLEVQTLMQPGEAIEVRDLFPLRPAWMARGACREPHPETNFFPTSAKAHGAAVDAARSVCAACPAQEPCLAYALANPELVGVWAGTLKRERRELRRAS